jgi:hypothetical protein
MIRPSTPRRDLVDLLSRPPCRDTSANWWMNWLVSPADQVEQLADLYRKGLMSAEEFERQKAKIFEG